MLDEQVQEELGIGAQTLSPFREGWITGLATAVGALIPVFPFLLFRGSGAIVRGKVRYSRTLADLKSDR